MLLLRCILLSNMIKEKPSHLNHLDILIYNLIKSGDSDVHLQAGIAQDYDMVKKHPKYQTCYNITNSTQHNYISIVIEMNN